MGQRLIRRVIRIAGMTSAANEKQIEKSVAAIEGILQVKAIYSSSNVYITYDGNMIKLDRIMDSIELLGYKVNDRPDPKPVIKDKTDEASGNTASKLLCIKGMTCTSCEMRIENKLKKIEGVIKVKASYSNSSVNITYNTDILRLDTIVEEIEKLDYRVKDKSGSISCTDSIGKRNIRNNSYYRNNSDYSNNKNNSNAANNRLSINQILGIGIIIFAAYIIIKNTIGFNFIPQVNQNMGYGILLAVGLITSLHCIAMCGGINLSQCVSYKFDSNDSNRVSKLKPSLMYNAGRVISYTIVGGIAGTLGSAISFSGVAKGIIAIVSGVFMVIMGLNMLNIFPWLRKFNPRMPKIFGNKVHNNDKKHGPFYVGLLNGLMPCGPLQAMQIYALGTGSFFAGALSMFLFSVGTVPLMFGFGAISSLLSSKFTHKMMKVSAILVIALGVVMLNRGLNLSGINVVYASALSSDSGNVAKIEGNIQTVATKLESGKYMPIIVQKGIPVKWNMRADAKDINGCNYIIIISKYGIQKKLEVGDNIIEFTPDTEGNIPYTCWMGMISSNIKVVPDLTKVTSNDISQAAASNNSGASGGGGCCAAGSQAARFKGGKVPTDDIQVAGVKNNRQEVTVIVDNQGYSPAAIVLQKGVQTKIIFDTQQLNSCNSTVYFPEYQGGLDLQQKKETPWITPTDDFTFQCGMGMLHGYVKVVDDVNKINLDDIKKEINNYTPARGGGCCGG